MANQFQICSRKSGIDGTLKCLSFHELIFKACQGILDPNFGLIKIPKNNKLSGSRYRVVTIVDEPFVSKKVGPNGTITWSGFSIELLEKLAKKINFEYEIFEGTDYGSKLKRENGTHYWSGLVGEVESGRADFAVSAMTVTPQREEVVDFTKTPFF